MMLPCGTPHVTDMRSDDFPETLTDCVRPHRNDSSQDRAIPWTPNDICRLSSRMLWSTVSNATDKSSRHSRVTSPRSAARSTSVITFIISAGNGISLEKVDKFCYLGDMLDADEGCDSAVTARVRSAWKKFREYLPVLTGQGFSLKLKGKVYATYVRNCLMHGNETWPMKVEHVLKMNCTEMSMIRWMCGVKLNTRKKSEELRELLGLVPVSLMIKNSRLRWFGHVQRKDDNDWVRRCITCGKLKELDREDT